MKTREEVIAFCIELKGAVEDYPFHAPPTGSLCAHEAKEQKIEKTKT